jgi:hypothetical protein
MHIATGKRQAVEYRSFKKIKQCHKYFPLAFVHNSCVFRASYVAKKTEDE